MTKSVKAKLKKLDGQKNIDKQRVTTPLILTNNLRFLNFSKVLIKIIWKNILQLLISLFSIEELCIYR